MKNLHEDWNVRVYWEVFFRTSQKSSREKVGPSPKHGTQALSNIQVEIIVAPLKTNFKDTVPIRRA